MLKKIYLCIALIFTISTGLGKANGLVHIQCDDGVNLSNLFANMEWRSSDADGGACGAATVDYPMGDIQVRGTVHGKVKCGHASVEHNPRLSFDRAAVSTCSYNNSCDVS